MDLQLAAWIEVTRAKMPTKWAQPKGRGWPWTRNDPAGDPPDTANEESQPSRENPAGGGEVPDTNFSVIDPVTELRFSFCLVENGQGKEQWSASITRTVDGTRKSAVVYAGTPNTLIDRWETTMNRLREKAREIGA